MKLIGILLIPLLGWTCDLQAPLIADQCLSSSNRTLQLEIELFGSQDYRGDTRLLEVIDPMGAILHTQDVTLSNFGHWIGLVEIPAEYNGTYTVRYSCNDGDVRASEFSVASLPEYSLTTHGISCAGTSDASIQIIPGRAHDLEYLWSDGSKLESRSDLAPGTYQVTISSSNGCTTSETIIIPDVRPIVPNLRIGAFNCGGQTDSLVVLQIEGGTPPYRVDWSYDGMGDYDDPDRLYDMEEGFFELDIKDANDCVSSHLVQVYYNATQTLNPKSVVLQSKFYSNGLFVYDLKEALNLHGGDVDDDGNDGSIFEVSYHNTKSDAMANVGPMPETYKSNSPTTIYARIESSNSCFVVSQIELAGTDFCFPQSELCDNDPPLLLRPEDCDDLTPLPGGGTYEIFLDEKGVLIPRPDLITCDPMTGDCILDPTNAEGSYEIDYTYFDGSSNVTRTALLNIQAVNPSIRIDFDTICGNSPIFRFQVNPMGGRINGPGIIDSMISRSNLFYYVDPALLNTNAWSMYTYTYGADQGSTLRCEKTTIDSLFVADPVYVDVSASAVSVCSTSTLTLATANVRGLIDRIEWYDPNGNLIGYGSTQQISANQGGSYMVRAVGVSGCLDTAFVSVTLLPLPQLLCNIASEVSCPDGKDANLEVDIQGVIDLTGYSILWDDGNTDFQRNGVGAGTYRAIVTNPLGCSDSCVIIVSEPDVLDIECQHVMQEVTCHGGTDGIDSVHVTGGTPPYRYSLDGINFQTSNILMNVPGGMNVVYILDANDCLDSCGFTMPQPPEFTCASTTRSSISCHNGSDGVIEVIPIGGNPPYSVVWNTGSTQRRITGLSAGTYSVQITDSKGCVCSETVILRTPPELVVQVQNDTVPCFNDASGQLQAMASGGVPPYSYNWTSGGTGIFDSNLPAGDYVVQVTDANGCIAHAQASIIQPNQLSLTCTDDLLNCFGDVNGSVQVMATGGTPPYQYLWSDGQTTAQASGLPAGDHIVVVTDAEGCVSQCTSNIAQPLPLSIQLEKDSVCLDFAKNISSSVFGGNPGYRYEWTLVDPGSTEATMANLETPGRDLLLFNSFCLKPGTVRLGLKVTDGLGCVAYEEVDFDLECCFDLAIRKTVDNPFDYRPGDTVNFQLEVFNQGVVDAFDLVISDSSQTELQYVGNLNTQAYTTNPYDWITAKGNVVQTRIDHIPAGQSYFLDINFIIDPSYTGFELTNYAGVTGYSNGIKNLPIDQDDAPRRRLALERNDDVRDDQNGSEDTPEDEDRFDFEMVFLCSGEPYGCNDLVQISLDENGEAEITPSIVGEGLSNPAFFEVEIRDQQGNSIGTTLNCNHIGQLLEYSLYNLCDSSTCWGNIRVEDKYGPEVFCAIPDTFYCHQTPRNMRPDTVRDNCTTWSQQVVSDEIFEYPCDSIFSSKRVIGRVYVDEYGNSSDTCIKEIYFKRYHISDIVFPSDTIIPCDQFTSADPSLTGVPEVGGDPIFPMTLGCSVALKYKDDTLFTCGSTFKIIRTWTAVDWCPVTSDPIFKHRQLIKTIDLDGPVVYCPGTFAIVDTFSTDENCQGSFELPKPKILGKGEAVSDSQHIYIISECSDFTYSVTHLPATDPQDCNPADLPASTDNIVDLGNGLFRAENLPFGCNWFYYEITDGCGNSTTCTFDVFIEDRRPPVAICDEHTTVSLSANGLAELPASALDAGSYDNCALDTFLVRRMNSSACQPNPQWLDVATFCCEDVGDTIMVELGVWDEAGNFNSCMVEVYVQNKALPILDYCPANVTLPCTSDYRDTSLTGGAASFIGTCPLQITFEDFPDLDDCGLGEIRRVWRAEDAIGNTVQSCEQIITLIDLNPVSDSTIIWPDTLVEFDSLCNQSVDTSLTGVPVVPNRNCHDILMTYKDQNLIREQGSCLKVLRTWTVVDWCQFDLAKKTGQWTFEQTIVIKNQNPPVIDCRDTIHVVDSEECGDVLPLSLGASDDCTPTIDLNWSIQIDFDSDGLFEVDTNNIEAEFFFDLGEHTVRYAVEDGCGNTASCIREVEIRDGKQPSPVCKNGVITVIMSGSGEAEIWAQDLNDKSFDNCTREEDLIYSFSSNSSDQVRTYNCDSLSNGISDTFEVQLWVTDEAGNQDYCITQIVVQDNALNLCQDNITSVTVSGKMEYLSGVPVEAMPIACQTPANGIMSAQTDEHGKFALDNLIGGQAYNIRAERHEDFLAGLSTKDLITIQHHLLAKRPFENWHQWLCADVDRSKSVSVRDVVHIRKLLLGKVNQFPNDVPSFVGIKTPTVEDKEDPLHISWEYPFQAEDGMKMELLNLKLGDVDASFTGATNQETRDLSHWSVSWLQTERGWDLISNEFIELYGMQLSLKSDKVEEVESKSWQWSSANWNQLDSEVYISVNQQELVSFHSGQIVLSIVGGNDAPLITKSITAEAYDPYLEVYGIHVEALQEPMDYFQLYQNIPNPFDQSTSIPFTMSQDGSIRLSVFNSDGRMIHEVGGYYRKGEHQLLLTADQLKSDGVMYYRMQVEDQVDMKKMIRLE